MLFNQNVWYATPIRWMDYLGKCSLTWIYNKFENKIFKSWKMGTKTSIAFLFLFSVVSLIMKVSGPVFYKKNVFKQKCNKVASFNELQVSSRSTWINFIFSHQISFIYSVHLKRERKDRQNTFLTLIPTLIDHIVKIQTRSEMNTVFFWNHFLANYISWHQTGRLTPAPSDPRWDISL